MRPPNTGDATFAKVADASWLDLILPFHFGIPTFDPVTIMVMIESTDMFPAPGDMTGKRITRPRLSADLRTDGLGTLIGGLFNTFAYTSLRQNVGPVGVTGIRSHHVCVAGGIILIVLGLLPKMGALVEPVPAMVPGGAGLVMLGMFAVTGIRILAGVNFAANRNNLFIRHGRRSPFFRVTDLQGGFSTRPAGRPPPTT